MEIEVLLQGLSAAAKSPLAFVAYCLVVLCWATIGYKEARFRMIAKSLEFLPENQRLEAMKLEYGLEPKKGLSPELYLSLKRKNYIFLAFAITVVAILLISTLTIYRSIQIDKANVAKQTMNIAYETFIRGTTTADDNRFKNAIGKLEEALAVNPSYSGYSNLADIYDEVGNVDGALWASRKAAALDPTNPSPQLNIGMYLKDKGKLQAALKHSQKALSLFQNTNIDDDEFMVAILVNIGNIYYEMAESSSGEQKTKFANLAKQNYYQPALELRGGMRNKRFLANLLGNAANNHRLLKEFDAAEDLMFQSISIKEKLSKQSSIWSSLGIGYFNLGDIYLKQGNLDDANKYFNKSEDIFLASDHQIGLGSIHLAKGEIAFLKNNFQQAKQEWLLARQIFASNGLNLYTNKAVNKLKLLEN
ncbi:tetratricopeptide repeat protein [Vibrio splendidus]|uniref:tetratricopeptide repeat protein n=1 Tax=Vibrio splendidus TaxID=29497 RepID=UPI002469BC99|nr:tetratricopeptide repeat protein [Vibrio splendidus]MDH5897699.1 tetratricopeptide repeat protein [Vibrio splendidus]